MAELSCKQCGGQMNKTSKADSSFSGQAFGCAVFVLGFALLFWFPVGTIIGLFVMLGAMGMGYKKSKVWKCQECGYFFERA